MNRALPPPRSPPPLFGRDREFAALQARLNGLLMGQGGLVLIGGEAGIGKTALAAVLAQEAAGAGAQVYVGHCYDGIETPPYGPWIECLTQFRMNNAGDVSPSVTPPSFAAAPSQGAFFAQIHDFTVTMVADRPLVLVLEDLHWADTASLDLLRFLARTLASTALLLVVTYRDDELHRRHPLAGIIPLLVREASADRLNLRPFNTATVDTLVRTRYALPDADAASLAAYLIERTGGNALFVTELLRTLEEERLLRREGGEGGAWKVGEVAHAPVPRLLKQIIDARLTRLGDTEDALLAVAAVIGHAVPLTVWQTVAHANEETLVALVERAEAVHLVVSWTTGGDGFRFAHALVRETLYEGVPALRRRRLHRHVGEALAALPDPDPDTVAYHFRRANDERAVAWLVQAAERAEDAFARRTAAERYEAAVELLLSQPGTTDESGWLRLRAAILRRYEDADAARAHVEQTLEVAREGGDPRLLAYARIIHGYTLASHGAFGAALAEAHGGLGTLATSPPGEAQQAREEPFAAHLHSGPFVVWLAFIGSFAEARAQGERLLHHAPTPPTTREDAARDAPTWAALAYIYAMQGDPERARHADDIARVAYDTADRHLLVIPPIRAAFAREMQAYVADDPRERERIVGDAEGTTRRAMGIARPDEGVDYARYLRLPLLVVEGRWQEASRLAEQLWAAYKSYSVLYPRMIALGTIARAQGAEAFAWQLVREAFPKGVSTEPGDMHFSFALSMQRLAVELALDSGDREAARAWLDAHTHWLDWSGATLGRAYERVLWAQYHRLAGRSPQAEADVQAALAAATDLYQPLALLAAHRLLGELATAGGRVNHARDHIDAALTLADTCRAPYERALTLLARAELAVAAGGIAGATTALDEVRTLCTPLDARPALARADGIAARIAAHVPAAPHYPGGLSGREIEVLRLVATGLTNAQVAGHLFLSSRTINGHLTTIYTKLNVPSRAAAIRFALEHGLS